MQLILLNASGGASEVQVKDVERISGRTFGVDSVCRFAAEEQFADAAQCNAAVDIPRVVRGVQRLAAVREARAQEASEQSVWIAGNAPPFAFLVLGQQMARTPHTRVNFVGNEVVSLPTFAEVAAGAKRVQRDVESALFTTSVTEDPGSCTHLHIDFIGQPRRSVWEADSDILVRVKSPSSLNLSLDIARVAAQILIHLDECANACAESMIVSVSGPKYACFVVGVILGNCALRTREVRVQVLYGARYILCPLVSPKRKSEDEPTQGKKTTGERGGAVSLLGFECGISKIKKRRTTRSPAGSRWGSKLGWGKTASDGEGDVREDEPVFDESEAWEDKECVEADESDREESGSEGSGDLSESGEESEKDDVSVCEREMESERERARESETESEDEHV